MSATSPIIIGGNGGSGTRVVAEILSRSGIFFGRSLHPKNQDDQFFVLLLRRAKLLGPGLTPRRDVPQLLALHRDLLLGQGPGGLRSYMRLLSASWDHGRERLEPGWLALRWRHLLSHQPQSSGIWGWKEPNTHLFLESLAGFYPEARFVLVLRNGLDMAFSRNRQQLKRWGRLFGLDPEDRSPRNCFEYWYRSNQRALAMGEERWGNRFLRLPLEDLCLEPDQNLARLLSFAGLPTASIPQEIRQLPRLPASSGRYLRRDTSWIDVEVRRMAAELGYPLPQGFQPGPPDPAPSPLL